MNALMMASARGFADLAKVLLMEGAEPELEDWVRGRCRTPLSPPPSVDSNRG